MSNSNAAKLAGVALLAALLSIALLGPTLSLGTQDPAREVTVSSQDALNTVASFLPPGGDTASELRVTSQIDGLVDRHFVIQGNGTFATVDVHSGRVTSLLLGGLVPKVASTSVGADQVAEAAVAFLTQHAIPTSGLSRTVRLVDHGDTADYEVSWTRIENGIQLPDTRLVRVDRATGLVFAFFDMRRPFAPPPSPALDRIEATKVAVEVSGLNATDVIDPQLTVTFDINGLQRLVWRVYLKTHNADPTRGPSYEVARIVDVDAITGYAEVVGQG